MATKRQLSGDAFNHETITVTDSAIGFTAATRVKSDCNNIIAIVTAEGGHMRYRYDGTDSPSTTTGHLLAHGDMIVIEGSPNVAKFKAIRVGSVNGILRVTYEAVHG